MPSILAATIVFTGLILQLQTDPANPASPRRAVLVDAKSSHSPELIVANAHRVMHSGNWNILQTGTASRPWRYDLSDARLRVVGVSGDVTKSPEFENFVPSLHAVLKGPDDLAPAVQTGSALIGGRTAAYLEYSGGALNVPACFRAAAAYDPPLPGGPQCIAREVNFTLSPSTDWEIQDVDDPSRRIVFRRNAIVRIRNDSHTRAQHQKHYAQLLVGGTEVRDIRESDLMCTPKCELVGLLPSFGASVECSNNQWP